MFPRLIYSITSKTLHRNARAFVSISKKVTSNLESYNLDARKTCLQRTPNLITIKRLKRSSKRQRETESDSEGEEENDEFDVIANKIITSTVSSLRMENILKVALGISRRKIEDAFYEGKVRLNGKMMNKKSMKLNVGDEIDMIVSKSPQNADLLIVHRAQLLNIFVEDDKIYIKVARNKNLLIEDI